MSETRETFAVGVCDLVLLQGRLEALQPADQADVLVSSDDNYLTHGGGVSRALWRAGGVANVGRGLDAQLPLGLGDVATGPAGDLAASQLLHAVTLDLDRRKRLDTNLARRLYGEVLDTARTLGARRIAIPLLGAGGGRLSSATSAAALADAMAQRWTEVGTLDRVTLVILNGADFDAVRPELVRRAGPLFDLLALVAACRDHLDEELVDQLPTVAGEVTDPTALADTLDRFLTVIAERNLRRIPWRQSGRLGERTAEYVVDRGDSCSLVGDELTAGELGRVVLVSYETLGHRLPSSHTETLQTAISARNRLVHGRLDAGGQRELALEVLAGVRRLGLLLLQDEGVTETVAVSSASTAFEASAGSLVAADSGGSLVATVGAAALGGAALGGAALGGAALGGAALGPGGIAGAALGIAIAAGKHLKPSKATKASKAVPPPAREAPSAVGRATQAATAGAGADGTGPVRQLHTFLLSNMDAEARAEWERRLHEENYAGTFENRFLEFCVRVEDPATHLADEFTRRELIRELKARSISVPATATGQQAARLLLRSFGFPIPTEPIGLASIRERIRQLKATSHGATSHGLAGAVIEAGAQLEFGARILLHFISRAVFKKPIELLLRDFGAIKSSDNRAFEKYSLGTYLHFLEVLTTEVQERSGGVEQMKLPQLDVRRLVPAGTQEITSLRNSFAHFTKLEEGTRGRRKAAEQFFCDATAWLEYLDHQQHRVFPHVIRVNEIRIDGWGRRTVEAVSDSKIAEILFTDVPVQPGELYFMHPRSNPLRVDPVLVLVGDLLEILGR